MTEIKNALQPRSEDARDFSLVKRFGTPNIEELPSEYIADNDYEIKDQQNTFFCVGCAVAGIPEMREGMVFDECFQIMEIAKAAGATPTNYTGTDLRTGLLTGVRIGLLPKIKSPYSLQTQRPEFILDPNNWHPEHEVEANKYRQGSFFDVEKGNNYDRFDSIRAALWHHRDTKDEIVTGASWRSSWSGAVGGVIPKERNMNDSISNHAFIFKDWRVINGEPYVRARLSNGPPFGLGGYFYFSRETINRECDFGNYMYKKDVEPGDIKWQQWSTLQLIKNLLLIILRKLQLQPVVPAIPPPIIPVPAKEQRVSRILPWAKAIEIEESSKPPTPQDRNIRNNNPGNLKYTAYTYELGAIDKDKDNFCIFQNYEDGLNALCQFLSDACNNKLPKYKNVNLRKFTAIYAMPPNTIYADNVARLLGVTADIPIKQLL